jgi:biopolymer transport protein ExbB
MTMVKQTVHALLLACVLGWMPNLAWAQDATPDTAQDPSAGFTGAAADLQKRLEDSLAELAALRAKIAEETLPLSRELRDAEAQLAALRADYQKISRSLDTGTQGIVNTRAEIKSRQDEAAYLSNLVAEYNRNFESRLHIAELQRYKKAIEDARLALENSQLTAGQVFDAHVSMVKTSITRLDEALGGVRFEGKAVDADGNVDLGTYLMLGPVAIFRSADGQEIGTAEQRMGSLEPAVVRFQNPLDVEAGSLVVLGVGGAFPLDASLGNAHKVQALEETLWEHIKKGGPVMWPIFVVAGAALLVALWKWISMMLLASPKKKQLDALFAAVASGNAVLAKDKAESLKGPVGRMLVAGVEHMNEPKELMDEVMYEHVLTTRLKANGLLPFIAISATSAPLLGLLGTVTGIMNTFTLMTVFGTGDVKTLSSGISEALITTEYGLIVAIPSLLIHSFLSRKAKSITDEMDKAAIVFGNEVARMKLKSTSKAA